MIEWLIALGIGLVITIIIYSLSFSVMVLIIKRAKLESNVVLKNQWITSAVVSPIVLLLSLLAIFLLSSGSLQLWGFQIPDLSSLLILSSIGLVVALMIVGASEWLSPTPEKMKPPSNLRGRVIFFVLIVVLTSISEELLFRGFLQNILDNALLLSLNFDGVIVTAGAVVSAIIFGVIHIAPAKQMGSSVSVLTISAIVLGFVAGLSLTASGSILLPIIVHIEFNLVGFIFGIWQKSG